MSLTVNIDEVRQRIKKGEQFPPEFITWLNKHPDITGTHRFSVFFRENRICVQLKDPYPPTKKQQAVRRRLTNIARSHRGLKGVDRRFKFPIPKIVAHIKRETSQSRK